MQITPKAANSFISLSKSREKGYYWEKTVEKVINEKVCRICGKSPKFLDWDATLETEIITNISYMLIVMAIR